ncbi:MAG: YdbL family protein [Sneathiellaceae bacterium]
MTSRRRFLAGLASGSIFALGLATLGSLAGSLLLPRTARAQTPEQMLRAGTAGERFDGYMEARDPSVAAAVAEINAKRRAVYQERATQQGAPVEAVAKVYAGEIINRAPGGSWILQQDGRWVQK